MYTEREKVAPANITEVMQTAYIDYSMSVIISRALPDARDGLKPVQRRILYAMLKEGLIHNRSFDKCAGVVGEVLKNYHPHGDTSVYDTLVRLAQPWVMRYPLIDPQGNFGSVDGDAPAAYRYTECRLTAMAEDLLRDLDEETVDFAPNYKESTVEPTVLPSGLPNLLMNGSTGIAVGMATNIPPHNLGELCDAIFHLLDHPYATVDDVIKFVRGPDFPTGGAIMGRDGIDKYLRTGRGIVKVRGTVHVEELKQGKEQIVITELPYNVNRATLVTKIAELIGDKTLDGVSDLRDESDEKTRVVIELKRGEVPRVVVNQLFKLTALESSFGVILLALDRRRPKEMNIKELLDLYIEHRREVIRRRTEYRLRQAYDRAHTLEGYLVALDVLDDIVAMIRASASREDAKERLMARYGDYSLKVGRLRYGKVSPYKLSEKQVDAILDLRLYQLTGLEKTKIENEYEAVKATILDLEDILENEKRLLGVIKAELTVLRDKYADPRRTQLLAAEGEFKMEDLIANEGCVITVSHNGFIKRTPVSDFRTQRRGGKGVIGSGTHDEDFTEHLFTASTHDTVLFFMNNGRVYVEKVYDIPEGTRTSKGKFLANVLEMQKEEKLAAMICVREFTEDQHLVMGTLKGTVKKTVLTDYQNARKGGIIGINIDDGDRLIGVLQTTGDDDLVIITHQGMSIRFSEKELRPMGRATYGVRGITLKESDQVEALVVVNPKATLLIAGENGQGKRTPFDDWRVQGRGGQGVIAIVNETGVAGALSVREEDEIMMLSHGGQAVRVPVKDVRVIGRTTQGVRLINLEAGDRLIGICRVIEIDEAHA